MQRVQSGVQSRLTTADVAELLEVRAKTVDHWCKQGWLEAEHVPGTPHNAWTIEGACLWEFCQRRPFYLRRLGGGTQRVRAVA
jgi:hypothetical protein